MAMRTHLRQQLLKEQSEQQPFGHALSALSASASIGVGPSGSSASASEEQQTGLASLTFSRLENPTPYHLAKQQQQQQQFISTVPVASVAAAASPSIGFSPKKDDSPNSDQLLNDMEVDFDFSGFLADDIDVAHLSSTAPNQVHFPLSSGKTFGDFRSIGEGDVEVEAKPSTSAPASTHLFLTGSSRLSAQQFQQPSIVTPASLESSDSRAASVASSLTAASSGQQQQQQQPRDRSRKDSHNRIERKRRENINYQIGELGEIIPRGYFIDGDLKKNKGNILRASVNYIRELQAEQAKLSDRVAQSELRAEKLEQMSRALATQIQNMQQRVSDNGLQYQQVNSIEEGVFNGLLNFLANPPAAQVKPEPLHVVQSLEQDAAAPVAAEEAVAADDCLRLSEVDPMFGFSDANSPLFFDQ